MYYDISNAVVLMAVIRESEKCWLVDHSLALSYQVGDVRYVADPRLFHVCKPHINSKNIIGDADPNASPRSKKRRKGSYIRDQEKISDNAKRFQRLIVDVLNDLDISTLSSNNQSLVSSKSECQFAVDKEACAVKRKRGCVLPTMNLNTEYNIVTMLHTSCNTFSTEERQINGDISLDHQAIFKRMIRNNSQKSCLLSAFGDSFIIPQKSSFVISDIADIQYLVSFNRQYDLIVVDPPWENKSLKRSKRYYWLDHTDMESIPISTLLKPGGIVAVWVTNKQKLIDFVTGDLFRKWNLNLAGVWYWLKVTTNGEYVFPPDSIHKKPYEPLIIGRHNPDRIVKSGKSFSHDISSSQGMALPFEKFICSVPSRIHSQKPPLNEVMQPFLPKEPSCLELFARSLIPCWTSWGNETIQFQSIRYFVECE